MIFVGWVATTAADGAVVHFCVVVFFPLHFSLFFFLAPLFFACFTLSLCLWEWCFELCGCCQYLLLQCLIQGGVIQHEIHIWCKTYIWTRITWRKFNWNYALFECSPVFFSFLFVCRLTIVRHVCKWKWKKSYKQHYDDVYSTFHLFSSSCFCTVENLSALPMCHSIVCTFSFSRSFSRFHCQHWLVNRLSFDCYVCFSMMPRMCCSRSFVLFAYNDNAKCTLRSGR